MSSILARVCRLSKKTESSGTGSNDVSWVWVAGGAGLLGASYGLGWYLTRRKNEAAQKRTSRYPQRRGKEQSRSVIPGDFRELNDKIVTLIRLHVCDVTGKLHEALRKSEALSNHRQALEDRWGAVLSYKCLGQGVEDVEPSPRKEPKLFQNEVELEILSGVINDLRQKLAVLQPYLDGREPVLRFSSDSDNPPEVFTCPITFDVMDSPVVAADGFTYEEESIRKWLRTSRVSPRTNEEMRSTLLQPNNALRLAIARWREEARPAPSKPSWDLVTT